VESRRRRVDALIARTASAAGSEPWEESLARLTEAERIAQALPGPEGGPEGDRLRLARVHLWMGRVYYPQGRYRQCIAYYQRALSAARERGDNELIGLASSALGHVYASRGHFGQAEAILRQMLDPPERAGDRGEQAQTLMLHGAVLAYIGDYAGGVAEIQRAYARLRETNALTTMAFNRYLLSLVYRAGGDLPHAIEAARQGLAMAEQSGRPISIYDGHMTLGWALCRAGKLETAASYAAKAHLILREQGGRLVLASELAALDAEIALCSGRVREAVALADKAVDIPQERKTIQSEGLARRTWGQALAALETPQWTEAEAQLAHSLRLFEAGENRLEAARTQEAWGAVCRDRGDLALARAHWEQAAAQWERSGLSHELARTQALIESLTSEES
jgi:tetratricopeptide (TPR) repeat protein